MTTTTPTRNVELFRKVADAIEREPDRYNQRTWLSLDNQITTLAAPLEHCKTVCCVAGHAIMESTSTEEWDSAVSTALRHMAVIHKMGVDDPRLLKDITLDHVIIKNLIGEDHSIPKRAAELLGLSNEEADFLFAENWEPESDLSVSDALRQLADGAELCDVSKDPDGYWDGYSDEAA